MESLHSTTTVKERPKRKVKVIDFLIAAHFTGRLVPMKGVYKRFRCCTGRWCQELSWTQWQLDQAYALLAPHDNGELPDYPTCPSCSTHCLVKDGSAAWKELEMYARNTHVLALQQRV